MTLMDDLPICDWLLQNSTSNVLELDEYPGLNQPTDLGPIVPSTTENFTRVKRRLVDYSSSPDVSDLEMLENPHGAATQVGEHCASPSLIPENDVLLVSANDEPLLDNEDTYKIDLGVPSCSGLHRPIRPSSSSDSTISDLDTLVHMTPFKKCAAEDVYSYSSAEDDDSQYFISKGQITPKKLIISSSYEMYKTKAENFSVSDGDYNINLKKQSNKTPFQIFLPTPNYAQVKTKGQHKKAMNYKGQRITKDLFSEKSEKQQKNKINSKVDAKTNKQQKKNILDKKNPNTNEVNTKKKVLKCKDITKKQQRKKKQINEGKDDTEEWYCYACFENKKLDMRQCGICKRWYHEECVGLSKCDKEFICSEC
ncbi:unnamed protein product [Parnassius mnemosyne]|uniref:Zinc finger PHD-type domain-containing protein n=1 Tax=Parnassius mnemosyne TaxID=213953 RepID=A0AAV1K7D7_9NEOP